MRYEKPEISILCGQMLREAIKHEVVAKILLNSDDLYRFFVYVDHKNFEVSSDAFTTFKVCIIHCTILTYERIYSLDINKFVQNF